MSSATLQAQAVTAAAIQLTLQGITSYKEFKDIQSSLSQVPEVGQMDRISEAKGLIVLRVKSQTSPQEIMKNLETSFPSKYHYDLKQLASGVAEIVVAKK